MLKRISLYAMAIAALAALFLVGQPVSLAARQTVARQPSGLAPGRSAVIDQVLQSYIDSNRVPGLVALVLQDGQPVYENAFGWADREAGRKMTTGTIFRIASQTKALTSTAILQLVEDGRLTLSTRVSSLISTFASTTVATQDADGTVTMVPGRRAITIQDLLTHTAGISYGTDRRVAALYEAKGLGPAAGNGWYTADKDEPICETMERLGTLPFVAQPGERFVYGYNTDILGCIVERVSGLPLDQYIRTKITAPLGLSDTQFFLPASQRDRLAAVYASGPGGTCVRAPEGSKGQGAYVDGPRTSFAGGAGLLSTARDYARFLEMIRRHGTLDGTRILSRRSVDLMSTNQSGALHSSTGLGFGLGFETVDRLGAKGMISEGAFGWGGAYGSTYEVDPAEHLVIVLMMQLMPNGTDLQTVFYNLVYSALR